MTTTPTTTPSIETTLSENQGDEDTGVVTRDILKETDPAFLELKARASELLAEDTSVVPPFWRSKYVKEAAKNWDLFYKRHETRFFQDRHWTDREFQELFDASSEEERTVILEVGCGVGNFIWPLLEKNPNLFVHACDFSKRAVDFVKANPAYETSKRVNAFVCDLTVDKLVDNVPPCSADLVSAIFVLSALPPEKMQSAVKNIKEALKPGGCVLFRDYGNYDCAQLRFKPGRKVEENLYVRQCGTLSYFFSEDFLRSLFEGEGFTTVSMDLIHTVVKNRKTDCSMERIFVQAKFRK